MRPHLRTSLLTAGDSRPQGTAQSPPYEVDGSSVADDDWRYRGHIIFSNRHYASPVAAVQSEQVGSPPPNVTVISSQASLSTAILYQSTSQTISRRESKISESSIGSSVHRRRSIVAIRVDSLFTELFYRCIAESFSLPDSIDSSTYEVDQRCYPY